jgi:excisionase family DNA binding protein
MGTRRNHLAVAPVHDPAADIQTPVPTVVPKRHLYRVPEAMALLSMSRSVLYEQIRGGRIRSVSQGRTRLIPAVAINEYVALLISESEVTYDQPA